MQCENHPKKKAIYKCPECETSFCSDCYELYNGECPECSPPILEKIETDECPSCFGEGERAYQGEPTGTCWECGGSGKMKDYLKHKEEEKLKEKKFRDKIRKK